MFLDNTMKHVANFSLKCDNDVVNMFENVLILRRHIVVWFRAIVSASYLK